MEDDETVHVTHGVIRGPGWRIRPNWVKEYQDGWWEALIGFGVARFLYVSSRGGSGELEIQTWTGEPGDSDGLAVVETSRGICLTQAPHYEYAGPEASSLWFTKQIKAEELFELLAGLRSAPYTNEEPSYENVHRGTDILGLPQRR